MKRKALFLFYFIFLFNNFIFSFQNSNNGVYFDSIYKIVSFHSKKKDNKKALFYSRILLKKALENKNINQEAKSYYKLADFFRKLNKKDSAFYYYNKAKNKYIQIKDSINVGKSLLNIAIIESDFGSYSSSDSTAVQTLKFLNNKKKNFIASTYNCLAINAKKQFLFDIAISNYNKAIKISDSKSSKNKYKNNLASLHIKLRNYSKSILIFEKLLKNSVINKKTKARIIGNLAYVKWLQNKRLLVLDNLLLSESILIREKDNYGLIASYSHLSDYFNEKDKAKSLFYAQKMYSKAKSENAINGLLEAIDRIIELENSKKAIYYLKESIRVRDSMQVINTKRQYRFAKIKYDFEEEEKKKLKFKNLAIENKLIAEQENNQKKNIFIFAILTTIGFVFYIYRRKQKYKKQILLETYKTETRIAKNLHDDLGNGIYNVIIKVLNPKFQTEEVVKDLDKIYLKTREISHQNDVIQTGDKFENYFRELVSNYNLKTCNIIVKDLHVLDLNLLPEQKQIVIYRVFNELFVNMKKHSNASLVVISCSKKNNFYEVIYKDNGIGFKDKNIILKNGLKNMEIRIKSIKGTIKFDKNLENGFKATIHFKK
ncbi:hypothetical protein [Polaribacter sp.]|uniref:tetratricopeptide repeat-containing sensor histidine kinase n=1 Tax=Polaribacter sp. TaxID=1920175 RepID=UPI003F6D8E55